MEIYPAEHVFGFLLAVLWLMLPGWVFGAAGIILWVAVISYDLHGGVRQMWRRYVRHLDA